jgi:2',3'-cyclic-nucleotide 2'-phosphodiesterase (5'-nucleotidase family)
MTTVHAQDIVLAKELLALTSSYQKSNPIAGQHGVDLILGGHDHLYFVSRGCDSWENFDKEEKVLGAEADEGDVLVIKSGTDFRDLSAITLELSPTPVGSIRTKVISKITGRKHSIIPGMRSSTPLAELLKTLLSSIGATLKTPICKTNVLVDVRSTHIRLAEVP